MSKIRVYEYQNCSTCKKALKFLESRGLEFEKIPIVDRPPSLGELKKMLALNGGDLRKLFNTSGQAYRELGLGEKLNTLGAPEALQLLASNGKLIKRPFVLAGEHGVVGFKEEKWEALFAPSLKRPRNTS